MHYNRGYTPLCATAVGTHPYAHTVAPPLPLTHDFNRGYTPVGTIIVGAHLRPSNGRKQGKVYP